MWAPGNGQAEPAPLPDPISNTGAPPHWRGAKWRAVRETSAKLAADPHCCPFPPPCCVAGEVPAVVLVTGRVWGPGRPGHGDVFRAGSGRARDGIILLSTDER